MTNVARWLIALDTEMVLRSGAAEQIEAIFAGRRGRKRRSLTWLGFLVTFRLEMRQKNFQFKNMASTYMKLPKEVRTRFGCPTQRPRRSRRRRSGRSRTVADKVLDDIHNMWRALCWELDGSPVTRPYPDAAQRALIYERRVRLCDSLGSGWLPDIPHDAHVGDGTAVDGFRNRNQRGDPHARLGHRTHTQRDPRKKVFGFTLVGAMAAAASASFEPPYVVLQHELVPANEPEGFAFVRVYRRHAQRCDLRWVVDDRFISNAPTYYSVQIAEYGGAPLHDLHKNLLGQKGVQYARSRSLTPGCGTRIYRLSTGNSATVPRTRVEAPTEASSLHTICPAPPPNTQLRCSLGVLVAATTTSIPPWSPARTPTSTDRVRTPQPRRYRGA